MNRQEAVTRGIEVGAVVVLGIWSVAVTSSATRPVLAMATAAGTSATLLLRRRWPTASLLAIMVGFPILGTVAGFEGPDDPFLVMLIWAGYSVGRHAPVRRQPWAAFIVLAFVALNVDDAAGPADIVFPFIFAGLPWLAGLSLQLTHDRARKAEGRARALDSEMAGIAERAEAEERLRIAREVHDVMGHTLTGLSLQAQTLRRRAAAGRQISEEEMRVVETTANELMADVRSLLGLLKSDDEAPLRPAPSLDELPLLIERSGREGQAVQLEVHGSARPLPPALSATAFRILQEALGNARRHGADGPVDVTVEWRAASVDLTIANEVDRFGARTPPGSGNGLAGMRERAHVHGGTVHVDHDDSRWRLVARLPTPEVGAVG